MRRQPTPPTDVRVVLDDGTEIAVDTIYVGRENRTHTWEVVNGPPLEQVAEIKIGMLPGKTQVTIS